MYRGENCRQALTAHSETRTNLNIEVQKTEGLELLWRFRLEISQLTCCFKTGRNVHCQW